MSTLVALLVAALHAGLMVAAAPLGVGLLRVLRARALGRAAPPLMQPWFDLARLARKTPVVAENASFVFLAAPGLVLAATALAALLVPSFSLGMATAPLADLIVIAGLLALSRLVLALAAMDSGAALGGQGASRTAMLASFAEPALLLVVLTVALMAGTTNLDLAAATIREGAPGLRLSLALALPALVAVALADNDALPVGGPADAEPSMTRAALLAEFSGRHLAALEAAHALRLLLWLDLLLDLFLPYGLAAPGGDVLQLVAGLVLWAIKVAALIGALALWGACGARLALRRVPEFLGVAILLGLLAAVLLFVSQGFA